MNKDDLYNGLPETQTATFKRTEWGTNDTRNIMHDMASKAGPAFAATSLHTPNCKARLENSAPSKRA